MVLSYILIVGLIIIDLVTKLIFSNSFNVGEVVTVIPNVLNVGYVQNTGASFGLLEGQQMLFFLITLVALILFGYFFSKSNWQDKKVYTIAFILLISGTLGNAIDRLLYGYVIDFVQMPFLPIVGATIFNIADVLLNAGVILLFIEMLIMDTMRQKKLKRETDD